MSVERGISALFRRVFEVERVAWSSLCGFFLCVSTETLGSFLFFRWADGKLLFLSIPKAIPCGQRRAEEVFCCSVFESCGSPWNIILGRDGVLFLFLTTRGHSLVSNFALSLSHECHGRSMGKSVRRVYRCCEAPRNSIQPRRPHLAFRLHSILPVSLLGFWWPPFPTVRTAVTFYVFPFSEEGRATFNKLILTIALRPLPSDGPQIRHNSINYESDIYRDSPYHTTVYDLKSLIITRIKRKFWL